MTIADGSTILSSDVNAAFTATMAAAQARAADKLAVHYVALDWRNLIAGTGLAQRTCTLVLPDDCWLEEVAATTVDQVGTVTVTITGASMLASPITLSKITIAGTDKLARYFADATKPQELLLRGSTITVVVSTTDAAGTQRLDVLLGFAVPRRRV